MINRLSGKIARVSINHEVMLFISNKSLQQAEIPIFLHNQNPSSDDMFIVILHCNYIILLDSLHYLQCALIMVHMIPKGLG